MMVDANALRRVSKIFGVMLFGSYLEAKQTADWAVELPEDDPEALEVVFNAAHGNIGRLPLELELDSLFQLAVTADKYLMVDVLRGPISSRWTCLSHPGGLWNLDMGRTSYQDLQRLCVITYFGSKEQLKHILVGLIYKADTDPEGRLIFTTMSNGDEDDNPEKGFEGDSEQQIREWKEFVPLPQIIIDFVRVNRQREVTALGIMVRCLVKEGVWSAAGTNAETCSMSVANLDRVTEELRATINTQVFNYRYSTTATYPIELPAPLGDTWRQRLENNLEGLDVMVARLSTELGARCKNGYLRI
ncbi:hypothetical protein KVR01_010506 [Diaporthe batatas]|uniref:uncharacterized protein n=1 Tax=Diaporthe batatas TaxID=748121 RepID=UPI001D05B7C3|nr:uncharacterized protein KVR01_010506 [Diaporthe batatas]KAG8159869.1 hypothetical protein KVR01_010506 [Diaporthe batatas]